MNFHYVQAEVEKLALQERSLDDHIRLDFDRPARLSMSILPILLKNIILQWNEWKTATAHRRWKQSKVSVLFLQLHLCRYPLWGCNTIRSFVFSGGYMPLKRISKVYLAFRCLSISLFFTEFYICINLILHQMHPYVIFIPCYVEWNINCNKSTSWNYTTSSRPWWGKKGKLEWNISTSSISCIE